MSLTLILILFIIDIDIDTVFLPRMVTAEESNVEELIAPLQFFVEVSSYAVIKGVMPIEHEIAYRKFNETPVAGMSLSES